MNFLLKKGKNHKIKEITLIFTIRRENSHELHRKPKENARNSTEMRKTNRLHT